MAINPDNINTIRVGELPPASFSLTDNIAHEVGVDLTRGTIQDLINFIAPLVSAVQYEVKRLHVNQTYIDDNFDITGLGINLMDGFAICNGQNGTLNMDGRVGVGYGNTYSVIGQTGGASTHTLTTNEMPIHHHHTDGSPFRSFAAHSGSVASGGYGNNSSTGTATDSGDMSQLAIGNLSANYDVGGDAEENNMGGGQPHNNMQPYMVELHVMKL